MNKISQRHQRYRVTVRWAGRVPYDVAWNLQKALVEQVSADSAENTSPAPTLLLLEHPPTYTFGRRGKIEHLLLTEAERERDGIALHWVDRGGDITYHGPGQLVVYPIINLRHQQQTPTPDVHHYLRQLEQVVIDVLAEYGILARRFPGYTGVWVDPPDQDEPLKIAAIGVKVSGSGVTSHGFALNVAPNLAHFAGIVPCGIADHGVTSMADLIDDVPTLAELVPVVRRAFSNVFQVETHFDSAYNLDTKSAESYLSAVDSNSGNTNEFN